MYSTSLFSVFDCFITAEVMKSLHIPKGVRRVLFRTLNTDRYFYTIATTHTHLCVPVMLYNCSSYGLLPVRYC